MHGRWAVSSRVVNNQVIKLHNRSTKLHYTEITLKGIRETTLSKETVGLLDADALGPLLWSGFRERNCQDAILESSLDLLRLWHTPC